MPTQVNFEVNNRTLRTDMRMNAVTLKMAEFIKEEAVAEGVEDIVVDIEMAKFAKISARIVVDAADLDFALAAPADSVAEIREKFHAFLNTTMVDVVDELVAAINSADAPVAVPKVGAPG